MLMRKAVLLFLAVATLIVLVGPATAQMMPAATSTLEPAPSASSTRTGRIAAPGATPATPIPLFVLWAMVPAT